MKTQTNKWKIAFWMYFAISLTAILYLFTENNSHTVHLGFTKMAKIQAQKDLKMISEIVNNTDLSKDQVLAEIAKDPFYKIGNAQKDTIELEKIRLVFEMGKLARIEQKEALHF